MSFKLRISPKNRKVARLIGQVHAELQKAFSEEAAKRNLTQADLAQALDVGEGLISRRLHGNSNLTLRIIAELAWALGDRDIKFELVQPHAAKGQNTRSAIFEIDGATEATSEADPGLVVTDGAVKAPVKVLA